MADDTPTTGTGDQIIVNPDALVEKIAEWRKKGYHVLAPMTRVMAFPAGYGVNVSLVFLNNPEDSYNDETLMSKDERAISRMGLLKIAQAAGFSTVPNMSVRQDDRRILNFWEFKSVGVVVGFDGTPQMLQGTVEIDLRDGSAQVGGWTPDDWRALLARNETAQKNDPNVKGLKWSINGWSEARVRQARRFGLRLAESKSMEAAIRQLGIKSKYHKDELERPFVTLRVAYTPDLSDPVMRQMVASRALAGAAALFADVQTPLALSAGGGESVYDLINFRDTREPELVNAVREPAETVRPASAQVPPPAPTPASAPVQPPTPPPAPTNAQQQAGSRPAQSQPGQAKRPAPEGDTVGNGLFVVDVKRTQKTGTSDRGPWRLCFVKFSNETEVACFDEGVVALAEKFKAEHTPCEPTIDRKGDKSQLSALDKFGTNPGLAGFEKPAAGDFKL